MVSEGRLGSLDETAKCGKGGRRMAKLRPKEVIIFDEGGFDALVNVYKDISEYIQTRNTLKITGSNSNRLLAG